MPNYALAGDKETAKRFVQDARIQGWSHVKAKRFLDQWGKPRWQVTGKLPREGKSFVRGERRRKNPVKVAATMSGKSTGWMKAKAVRVRVVNGRHVMDVKR